MRQLLRGFGVRVATGATVVVPIALTIWVCWVAFDFLDGLAGPSVDRLIQSVWPEARQEEDAARMDRLAGTVRRLMDERRLKDAADALNREAEAARRHPGLGIAVTLFLIYVVGVLASNLFGRRLLSVWGFLVGRIPLVGKLFGAVRQVVETLAAPGGRAFKRVILAEFPRPGIFCVGFVMNQWTGSSGERLASVFFPTAPNPTSGFLEVIPEDMVIDNPMSVEEAIRLVATAGYVAPSALAVPLVPREPPRAVPLPGS